MNAFLTAWRTSRLLPVRTVRVVAEGAATVMWRRGGRVIDRFESNLARVTGKEGDDLRALSREGLKSIGRYYAEALTLNRLSGEQIDARVRLEGYEPVKELLTTTETGVVAALSHCGNWDLVGAYAARHIIPVTAVAEVLKPQEVFDEFVAMREGVGIKVLGHEGSSTFRKLISITKKERTLVCLLADRDLSGSGVEVSMWGHQVKVAPGPAALAIAAKTVVIPIMVSYERLEGARRKAAKSPWGVVLWFGTPIDPADYPDERRVETVSQAWAGALAEQISQHPQDWHMLQKFGWAS